MNIKKLILSVIIVPGVFLYGQIKDLGQVVHWLAGYDTTGTHWLVYNLYSADLDVLSDTSIGCWTAYNPALDVVGWFANLGNFQGSSPPWDIGDTIVVLGSMDPAYVSDPSGYGDNPNHTGFYWVYSDTVIMETPEYWQPDDTLRVMPKPIVYQTGPGGGANDTIWVKIPNPRETRQVVHTGYDILGYWLWADSTGTGTPNAFNGASGMEIGFIPVDGVYGDTTVYWQLESDGFEAWHHWTTYFAYKLVTRPNTISLEDSIYFCDLVNSTAFGSHDCPFEFGTRMTPTELAPYAGYDLISVIWYHYDGSSPDGYAKIYDNGTATEPGAMLTQEPYSGSTTGWQRIDFSSPVSITGTGDLWLTIELNHPAGGFPAGVDAGPAVDGKGDWAYENGSWFELQDVGFDRNCQVIAIVGNTGDNRGRNSNGYATYYFSQNSDVIDVYQNVIGIEESQILNPQSQIPKLVVNPNPFSKSTKISFGIGQNVESMELRIFDATGRLVRAFPIINLCNSDKSVVSVYWDGKDEKGRKMSDGIYFVRLESGGSSQTQKVILLH